MESLKTLKDMLDYIKRKKREVINSAGGSDINYLRTLQTLTRLEAATEEEIEAVKRIEGDS